MKIKQSQFLVFFLLISLIGLSAAVGLIFYYVTSPQKLPERVQYQRSTETLASVIGVLKPRKIDNNTLIESPAIESPVIENPVIENPEIPQIVIEIEEDPIIEIELTFQDYLARQAELRLQSNVTYDGSYHKIAYPMGDVPENIGVCTDVVIRSYRALGIDLQERVHEDMKRNFQNYPKRWNLKRPDTNIDHRRVPNLMTYFERAGGALDVTENPFDYQAGNVVAWDLGKGLVHIGIVSKYVSETTGNPLIVHNIGAGPQMNDILFKYKIIGHYKYGEGEKDRGDKV